MSIDPYDEVSDWFWNLVGRADGSEGKLRDLLAALSRDDLIRFAREFELAAVELTCEPFTRYMIGQSEDGIEDIARWIVSQGREAYEHVIARPELTPAEVPSEPSSLHGVAQSVFDSRYDEAMPPEVYLDPSVSLEN